MLQNAPRGASAILLTFIKLPFVIKILVQPTFLLILFDSLFSACSLRRISKLKGMECCKNTKYWDKQACSNIIQSMQTDQVLHSAVYSWVKVFRIVPEFRISRLTFHKKSLGLRILN